MTIRAFISSTYRDLKDQRAYVIERLTRGGVFVDPMERWTAAADEPKELSQERVRDCDVCVLLVGFRRGYVPDGEALSITQMEYREALRRGIDVLTFMADDNADWPDEALAELRADPETQRWRDELKKRKTVAFFQPQVQSIDVDAALLRWMEERPREAARPQNLDVYPIDTRAWSNGGSVLIAWRSEAPIPGCLGFALQRRTLEGGEDQFVNTYVPFAGVWGGPQPSNVQPIQNFRWTDRPRSDRDVRYRVVPVIGEVGQLAEDFDRASGWTRWLSKKTGMTAGYQTFFDRPLARRVEVTSETRRTLLQLLIAAKGFDQRVFAALPELDDMPFTAAIRQLRSKFRNVPPRRNAPHFMVVCDRWGMPERVWIGHAAWSGEKSTAENSAMIIDSVPLARACLDRWEELRDEARRTAPPAQLSLRETSMTLWTHRRAAAARDAERLIRGARYGALFLLDPRHRELLNVLGELAKSGLWVQGVSGDRHVSGEDVMLFSKRWAPSTHTNAVVVDPFGSHQVVIMVAANGEMLIVEDAPGLASEWAVHLITVCDQFRFRAHMMESPSGFRGLAESDAWQRPYFHGNRERQFDCFFGTLPL